MQICRICLAADRKMYPIIDDSVHIYEHVTGLPFSSEDLLPKYVCWECGHYMSKHVAFKKKAMKSYCTLVEILNKDGLITKSSIENCNQSTLTHTSPLYLFVQGEYDVLETYDDFSNIVDVDDVSVNIEDENLKNDETLLSDDLIVSSPNIEGIDSEDEDKTLLSDDIIVFSPNIEGTDSEDESLKKDETLLSDDLIVSSPNIEGIDFEDEDKTLLSDDIIVFSPNIEGTDSEDESLKKDKTLLSDDLIVSSPNIEGTDSIKENNVENQSPSKLPSVKRKRKAKASEIIKDKKNSSEKSKKSDKITKLLGVKRKRVYRAKERKAVKLPIAELDKELFIITEQTLDEQIAEIQKRKESDNYLNSPLTCENCFKGFQDFALYKRHITRYSESRGPHVCPLCRIRFRLNCKLKNHMNQHLYKISCSQCNFSTIHVAVAKSHQKYHQGKTYECPHCNEVFGFKSTYLGHLRIKHPSDIICKHCGYTFLNDIGLKRHILRYHCDDQQIPVDGPLCGRCDIRFSCKDALDTHRRVSARHADERTAGVVKPGRLPKSTPQGYKRVSYRNAIDYKRVSSEPFPDGPRPCKRCEELLPSPKAYVVHFNKAHNKNYGKARMCEICGTLCKNSLLLRSHLDKHRVNKDFKCDRCDKLFQSHVSRWLHQRSHCGARVDHKCDLCGKTLSSASNLSRHMQIHQDLSFPCEYCGKEFPGQGNRKQHIEHVHKNRPWVRRSRPRAGKQAERQPKTVEENPSYESETDIIEYIEDNNMLI